MKNPQIDQLALAIFDMAESGLLDDMRAQRYPREVAALQNARLIIRQANGVYVPRSQLLGKSEAPAANADGSARLSAPGPGARVRLAPPPPAEPHKVTLGVRLEPELLKALEDMAKQMSSRPSTLARDLLAKLFRADDPLAASTQTIAVMHLVDGMTLEEVAGEAGMSVSGVRKRLRTLRARLVALETESAAEGV